MVVLHQTTRKGVRWTSFFTGFYSMSFFASISPSSPSPSPFSHLWMNYVSSTACLTCFLLRLDRVVHGSEADSQREKDKMKKRKEEQRFAVYKPSSLDPSLCLRSLTSSSPLLMSLVSCLAFFWWKAFLVLTFSMSKWRNATPDLLVDIPVCHF